MLPDFAKFKKLVNRQLSRAIDRQVTATPLLRDIQRIRQHEGRSGTVVHSDGTADTSEPRLESSEIRFDREQMRRFDERAFQEKLAALTKHFSDAHEKLMLEKVFTAASSVGNVVKGPPTKATMLEMLRRIETDFDPETLEKAPGQMIIMSPAMAERYIPLMQEWQKDPEFNAEYERVMSKQREAWRDREANRKLVG